MADAPEVAYVVYKDGYHAIVDTNRIKDFSLRSVSDLSKNKEVYWRSDAGGKIEEAVLALRKLHPLIQGRAKQ